MPTGEHLPATARPRCQGGARRTGTLPSRPRSDPDRQGQRRDGRPPHGTPLRQGCRRRRLLGRHGQGTRDAGLRPARWRRAGAGSLVPRDPPGLTRRRRRGRRASPGRGLSTPPGQGGRKVRRGGHRGPTGRGRHAPAGGAPGRRRQQGLANMGGHPGIPGASRPPHGPRTALRVVCRERLARRQDRPSALPGRVGHRPCHGRDRHRHRRRRRIRHEGQPCRGHQRHACRPRRLCGAPTAAHRRRHLGR